SLPDYDTGGQAFAGPLALNRCEDDGDNRSGLGIRPMVDESRLRRGHTRDFHEVPVTDTRGDQRVVEGVQPRFALGMANGRPELVGRQSPQVSTQAKAPPPGGPISNVRRDRHWP